LEKNAQFAEKRDHNIDTSSRLRLFSTQHAALDLERRLLEEDRDRLMAAHSALLQEMAAKGNKLLALLAWPCARLPDFSWDKTRKNIEVEQEFWYGSVPSGNPGPVVTSLPVYGS
jgi:hypothetical protein